MEDNFNQPLDTGFQTDDPSGIRGSFRITPEVRRYWKESANWGMFFSVLGFIYIGMILLSFLSLSALGANEGAYAGIVMLIVLAVVAPIVWLLFNFSRYTRKAVLYDDSAAAHVGFANLRRLFNLAGILVIVLLVLYGVIFVVSLLAMGM
jgi:cytochrome c biogenesis protein CcdA